MAEHCLGDQQIRTQPEVIEEDMVTSVAEVEGRRHCEQAAMVAHRMMRVR